MTYNDFASAEYTAGQLNTIIELLKKQAGKDGPERFIRGKLKVSEPIPSWIEKNGVIYLSVTSDGTTGEEWIERLRNKGFEVSDKAKDVLRSKYFKPTSDMTTEVAVLKGMFFEDNDRITSKICTEAEKRKLSKPNAEIACLIREKLPYYHVGETGFRDIVVMHEPIQDPDGNFLLRCWHNDDNYFLSICYSRPDFKWDRYIGFAFTLSSR